MSKDVCIFMKVFKSGVWEHSLRMPIMDIVFWEQLTCLLRVDL
jgi:hypothetical protein